MDHQSFDALVQRVAGHLDEHNDVHVELAGVRPLPGGACQDNFIVDATFEGAPRRFVLRSDAATSLTGSLDRRAEFDIIGAARESGVPTPAAHWLVRDLVRPGAWAYFLDWCDGIALGNRVIKDPALAGARQRLPEEFASAMAAVHRVTPRSCPSLAIPKSDPTLDPAKEGIAVQRKALDALPEAHPALELAWRWLSENRPKVAQVTLVHGDFRVGNLMVTPQGMSGLLDWEFAHWGDPMEDLAWLSVRDWRFSRPDKAVGGLCSREAFFAAYEEAAAHPVDRASVRWWEVYGNVRWATGAVEQGVRYTSGAETDLELLAIGRRAAEMEYEALRLIELGPFTPGASYAV